MEVDDIRQELKHGAYRAAMDIIQQAMVDNQAAAKDTQEIMYM